MPDPAVRLRFEARRFANPGSPTATRYSATFRAEVVAFARERLAAGVALARIARDVGVRPRTLGLWLRRKPAPKLRAVRVERDPRPVPTPLAITAPDLRPVVVFPGGVRVEGLDVGGVVRLVRSLA